MSEVTLLQQRRRGFSRVRRLKGERCIIIGLLPASLHYGDRSRGLKEGLCISNHHKHMFSSFNSLASGLPVLNGY